jgi:hypothetical protein
MAESLMNEPLNETRRQLREYLLPDTSIPYGGDDDGDHFPRSKVMRFAFNPRNRRLLMFSGSILAVLATRIVGSNGLAMVRDLATSLTRNRKR